MAQSRKHKHAKTAQPEVFIITLHEKTTHDNLTGNLTEGKPMTDRFVTGNIIAPTRRPNENCRLVGRSPHAGTQSTVALDWTSYTSSEKSSNFVFI